MESLCGRQSLRLEGSTLSERLCIYPHCLVDIGTGDGRFVQHVAQHWPGFFAVGIDACRENLRVASRHAVANTAYIIANAYALPNELRQCATLLTVNFPWGSLLGGLLAGHTDLLSGLASLARPGAQLMILLNGGAVAEAGWPLEEGVEQVAWNLRSAGITLRAPSPLDVDEVRYLPTTWAKRLAFGRDPRVIALYGTFAAPPAQRLMSNQLLR